MIQIRTIDLYVLRLLIKPTLAALAVTFAALILERILRLFDLLSGGAGSPGLLIALAANLAPHYIGLALPAAYAVGLIVVFTRLAAENELDSIEAAGWSLRRLGATSIACAIVLSIISIVLFGYLQPYSRHGYMSVRHQLLSVVWDARIEAGAFIDAGGGLTLSAKGVDATGRHLSGVFVLQKQDDGTEAVLTAERGVLLPVPEEETVRLRLVNGVALYTGDTASNVFATFDSMLLEKKLDIASTAFRPRGGSALELTLGELWDRAFGADGFAPDPLYEAELYARILRSLAIIGVPLIAIPLSVAGKRSPSWRRITAAIIILVAFQNGTKGAQAVAAKGDIDPLLALGGLGSAYFMLGAWLFITTAGQGGNSPTRKAFVWADRAIVRLAKLKARS